MQTEMTKGMPKDLDEHGTNQIKNKIKRFKMSDINLVYLLKESQLLIDKFGLKLLQFKDLLKASEISSKVFLMLVIDYQGL